MLDKCKKDGNIVYYGHKISVKRFLENVDGLANGFLRLGLKKGDVVTVYLPTCPHSVAAFYACSKLGLIASFVHPVTPLAELKKNMDKTGSKALMFYDVLVKDETKFLPFGVALIRCGIADYVTFRKPIYSLYGKTCGKRVKMSVPYAKLIRDSSFCEVLGEEKDDVCYMHSGGTSGEAKIVKLTNYAFNQTAETIAEMYHPEVDSGNYYLVTLPVFHAYGLCAAVHAGFLLGYNLALVPKYDMNVVNKYFDKYNITVWSIVPAMVSKMIKYKAFDRKHLKKLDVIWCGGDTLSETLVETVDTILRKNGSRAKLMRGYGLTETCGVCVVNNYDDYRKQSCGKPIDGCFVEIWDDDGNKLPFNTVGEIVLTAKGIMSGYLDGGESWAKDGTWIKTGDVGYVDKDGFVYVVDRKKRSVKIAAVNVFPAEVEECIKQLPFVDEACVVPYSFDGKPFLKAYVTLNGKTPDFDVEDRVIAHCRKKLIRYSVPNWVEVLKEMPRTKLAKIDYKKLEQK